MTLVLGITGLLGVVIALWMARTVALQMRATFSVLGCLMLLLTCTLRAQEGEPGAYFGLKGKVSVASANIVLNGGTTIVDIQDEGGASVHVFRPGDDSVVISFPKRIGGHYPLREDSEEEQALLRLLRAASKNTFGTADPKIGKDLPQNAVSRLIHFLSVRTNETEPETK